MLKTSHLTKYQHNGNVKGPQLALLFKLISGEDLTDGLSISESFYIII